MTATSTKMPHLGNCDYSVIILSRSHPILLVKYTNNWIARSNVKVNTENERFTVVCSRSRQNASVVISLCFLEHGKELF